MFRNQNRGLKRKRFNQGGLARAPWRRRQKVRRFTHGKRISPSVRVTQSDVAPDARRLTTSVIRNPTGLADRVFVKLQSRVGFSFTNTSGGYTSVICQANSAFDPFGSSSTAQPYLFDQWAGLYDEYRVHGFAWKVHPTMGATGIISTSNRECMVIPTRQSSAFGSALLAREQPRAQFNIFQVNSGKWATLEGYATCHTILGQSKVAFEGDAGTSAAVTADPDVKVYLHIATQDPHESTTVNTFAVVELIQYVEFFGRAIAAVS